jgi:hypothetical protein
MLSRIVVQQNKLAKMLPKVCFSSNKPILSEWVTSGPNEWPRPKKGIDYDPEQEEGYEVPGVFREHRH